MMPMGEEVELEQRDYLSGQTTSWEAGSLLDKVIVYEPAKRVAVVVMGDAGAWGRNWIE